jgi:hypothetical protein
MTKLEEQLQAKKLMLIPPLSLANKPLLAHHSTVNKQIRKDLSTGLLAFLGKVKLASLKTKETMKLLKNQLKNWQRNNQLLTEI